MTRHAIYRALVCTVVTLAAMAPPVHADSAQGGPFLVPRYGARAWGMAGAVIARIDDESAIDWNPAGLATAVRSAGISAVKLVPDAYLNQGQAAYVMPISHTRDAETGVARYAAGAMYTNISADVGAGETYSENHLRLALAYSPQPLITFAISGQLSLATTGVENFDAWGTGIDMGTTLRVTPAWSLAFVARDVFSRYSFEDGRDARKDHQWVAGIAHRVPGGIDLEADFVYVHDGWLHTLVGAETPYIFGRVALRSGIAILSSGEGRQQYAFGVSARATSNLFLHYAANVDDEDAFGTTQRFSLGVRW